MASQKRKNLDSVGVHYYDPTADTYPAWEGEVNIQVGGTDVSSANPVPVNVTSVTEYTIRIDEASATVTYIGEAVVGSAEASLVWKVKRMTDSSGDLDIKFADGDANYNNSWTNRASLSYS